MRSIAHAEDFYGLFDFGVAGIQMKTWMLGNAAREIYSLTGPPNGRYYLGELKTKRTPAVLVRQTGEAWNRPFVAIYEPFGNGTESLIKRVRRIKDAPASGDFVGVVIEQASRTDFVFNATDADKTHDYEGVQFKGIYGVVSADANGFRHLYLGTGKSLIAAGHRLESASGELVKAALTYEKPLATNAVKDGRLATGYAYSSDKDVTIRIPWKNVSKVAFNDLTVFVKTSAGFVAAKEILAVAGKNEETPAVLTARVSAAVNGELYVGEKS